MVAVNEADTKIFEYSKGERDEHNNFISVFGDPHTIKKNLDLVLPNRNELIDRILAGEQVKRAKATAVAAYEADPPSYLATVLHRNAGYQVSVTGPDGAMAPNPETPLAFAQRNSIAIMLPTEYTPNESMLISVGARASLALVAGIRQAFRLAPFNELTGKGCTDHMAIAVMNNFQQFIAPASDDEPTKPPTE